MNKKLWIIACTLLVAVIGTVNAQEYEPEKNFKVKKDEDGRSVRIVEYKGKNQVVNIPPKINKLPVREIEGDAFKGKHLTEITIPDSVRFIGHNAFNGNQISKITIGSNVAFINTAFGNEFNSAYESYKKIAGTYLLVNERWTNPEVDREIAEKKKEQEKAEFAKRAKEAAIGYLYVYSDYTGTILLNNEETKFTVREYSVTRVMVDDARRKTFSVAVRDSNGTVYQGGDVTFEYTGNYRYDISIINPNPVPNSGDDFNISQNAQGGITITGYKGSRPRVVIPQTIEGIKVTAIAGRAFQGKGPAAGGIYKPRERGERNAIEITSVVIPNTVTSIGERAFYDQTISEVIIPDSVTYIGGMAFAYGKISSLVLGRNIQQIDAGAFASNNISSVTLPSSLRIVGKGAFLDNRIQTLSIPNGVVFLDDYSFGNNPITTLVIPKSLATADDKIFVSRDKGFRGAFSNKDNTSTITTITLPSNVDSGNFYGNFSSDFQSFYASQGRKAGTYTWTGRIWTVK